METPKLHGKAFSLNPEVGLSGNVAEPAHDVIASLDPRLVPFETLCERAHICALICPRARRPSDMTEDLREFMGRTGIHGSNMKKSRSNPQNESIFRSAAPGFKKYLELFLRNGASYGWVANLFGKSWAKIQKTTSARYGVHVERLPLQMPPFCPI